jgi:Ca-activated chloride channel homolog
MLMTAPLQFTAPGWLWGLLTVPVFWWLYLTTEQRRWQGAFQLSALATHAMLQQRHVWFGRCFPITVSIVLACLWGIVANPVQQVPTATRQATLMLVMDISLSMLASDVTPTRLQAAQATASQFVTQLPPNVRVGLLLFAGQSIVVSPPITDHDRIARFLTKLTPNDLRPRTEIGTALQTAEQTLLLDAEPTQARPDSPPSDKVIVLLSDGDSREGTPWNEAATHANQMGITINTVAIGKPDPTTITVQGQVLPVAFNPATLQQVAQLGGGKFFQAFSQQDFNAVFNQLKTGALHIEQRQQSLAPLLAWVALVAIALQCALRWRYPWSLPV